MRVALDQRPVHERAGVALIGVADHVSLRNIIATAEFPFHPGRETGAAATTNPRVFDYLERFLPGS